MNECIKFSKLLVIDFLSWHGCVVCMERRNQLTANKLLTAQEAFDRTKDRKRKLEQAGYNVVECWEHELNKQLAENIEMKTFFNAIKICEPIEPRSCLYGGRTEVIRMMYECQPGEKINYIDVCR